MEIIAWITEEELVAPEATEATDEATSKLETVIDLQTRRENIKRRTKVQRRDLDHRRNNERHHAKLPIGLPQVLLAQGQGGQASAPAWKFTANILLKTQEKITGRLT
jgi:hypothetical protein